MRAGIMSNRGVASITHGQVTATSTAGVLVAARADRRCAILKNLDASVVVFVGGASVTTANGLRINAGETIQLDTRAVIYVITATTAVVAFMELHENS